VPQLISISFEIGLTNPLDYEDLGELEAQKDADMVIRNFFISCYEAGPTKCAFATSATSGDDLEKQFYALDDSLELTPAVIVTTEENINGSSSYQPDYLTQSYFREVCVTR